MNEERGYLSDFSDDRTAATLNDSYLNVKCIIIYPNESARVLIEIYADEESFNLGKEPIFQRNITIMPDDPDWETYLSVNSVANAGDTITSRVTTMLKQRYPAKTR